jgi:hypothetical protein
MDPKNVTPQERPDQTTEPQTATEQELDQVAGGVSDSSEATVVNNPLYTPAGSSGTNPLYKT